MVLFAVKCNLMDVYVRKVMSYVKVCLECVAYHLTDCIGSHNQRTIYFPLWSSKGAWRLMSPSFILRPSYMLGSFPVYSAKRYLCKHLK
jgi:hypothetical protein